MKFSRKCAKIAVSKSIQLIFSLVTAYKMTSIYKITVQIFQWLQGLVKKIVDNNRSCWACIRWHVFSIFVTFEDRNAFLKFCRTTWIKSNRAEYTNGLERCEEACLGKRGAIWWVEWARCVIGHMNVMHNYMFDCMWRRDLFMEAHCIDTFSNARWRGKDRWIQLSCFD